MIKVSAPDLPSIHTTVLLVDDDPIDRLIGETIFIKTKFADSVITQNSIISTVNFLSDLTNRDLPQIMFLDLNMPFMDGYDFLDILKKNPSLLNENCILYVLTNSISFIDKERITHFPRVRKLLTKPMTKALIEQILKDMKRLSLSD
ncbi:response regulator [Cytophagaceae bacterium YF14B1]|uniref:Response regulator n=1 Tax=Xanthocytophaga flava TaxID=3048013 RepID=A0AAE3QZ95_9BACT|nr:response regulator [Xanthocytophaga flavus]MDJ1486163.1 response regulator [Xanthocytophaga flavus]